MYFSFYARSIVRSADYRLQERSQGQAVVHEWSGSLVWVGEGCLAIDSDWILDSSRRYGAKDKKRAAAFFSILRGGDSQKLQSEQGENKSIGKFLVQSWRKSDDEAETCLVSFSLTLCADEFDKFGELVGKVGAEVMFRFEVDDERTALSEPYVERPLRYGNDLDGREKILDTNGKGLFLARITEFKAEAVYAALSEEEFQLRLHEKENRQFELETAVERNEAVAASFRDEKERLLQSVANAGASLEMLRQEIGRLFLIVVSILLALVASIFFR